MKEYATPHGQLSSSDTLPTMWLLHLVVLTLAQTQPSGSSRSSRTIRRWLRRRFGWIGECLAVYSYSFIYNFQKRTYDSEAFIDRRSEAIVRAWNRSGLRK